MPAFTYQVDCVKHLDFAYSSTARVGQVTIVIADGQRTQSCEHKHKLISKEKRQKMLVPTLNLLLKENKCN